MTDWLADLDGLREGDLRPLRVQLRLERRSRQRERDHLHTAAGGRRIMRNVSIKIGTSCNTYTGEISERLHCVYALIVDSKEASQVTELNSGSAR